MNPETLRRILEDIEQVLQHLLLDEQPEAALAFRDLKTRLHPPRPLTHCPHCHAPLDFRPEDNRALCPMCRHNLKEGANANAQAAPTTTNQSTTP